MLSGSKATRSEPFLLALSNFVREGTFYESANERDGRFAELVRRRPTSGPELGSLVSFPWLRSEAQMRSVSLVGAAEYVKAGGEHGRQVVASALQRA